ncbi:MAG TPA: hypothetical protein DCG78_07805 [Anaerolineaceae bacterium]|nr:hypothetical protein [Anaerolineaceae bacterium]
MSETTKIQRIQQLSFLGISLALIGVTGFYGYVVRPNDYSLVGMWIAIMAIGGILGGVKNLMIYKLINNGAFIIILFDIIIILLAFLIPTIPLPRGLSLLLSICILVPVYFQFFKKVTLPRLQKVN